MDIYVVEILEGNGFGKPEKVLGVNTNQNEIYPFVSNKSEIYFASSGHPGLGGLDIYVAKLKSYNTVEGVYNLGTPINTKYNDFSFIIDDGTRRGYFTSNRKGGSGEDDIYSFVEVKPLLNDCSVGLSGTVFDIASKIPIPNATLQLIDDENNILERVKTDENGFYSFSLTSCNDAYFIRARKDKYMTGEKFVPKTTLIGSATIVTNIELENTGIDVPRDFFASLSHNNTGIAIGDQSIGEYVFNAIYFDTGKAIINDDSGKVLRGIADQMKSNARLEIMISSYADVRGGNKRNLDLSNKRVIATFNYLVYLGVDPSRVTMKSFGETEPTKDCENPEIECTRDDYKKDRRSQFTIAE
ncbi:ompA family outer membrane protein [Elysia marginata]|uniref:OmpA family outer membrane protein n=1 Tax=Elysia marginata TaxID=1093978 RepID=A0AAV4FRY3_9GAST|nr:ompA family outer membrane protein [Elysia marginata]